MAKVQNALIGRASGSVGGATFSKWKGFNILKSKPESVANPKTAAQRSQRSRLSLMVSIYRLIVGVVTVGFKSLAINKSEYNAFVGDNIQDAVTPNPDGPATLIFDELSISKGTIGTVQIEDITAVANSSAVGINFPSTLPVGGEATDLAYGVVYNETQDLWYTDDDAQTRDDEQLGFNTPAPIVAADVLHCYLFFKSANDTDVSDSVYFTGVVA